MQSLRNPSSHLTRAWEWRVVIFDLLENGYEAKMVSLLLNHAKTVVSSSGPLPERKRVVT